MTEQEAWLAWRCQWCGEPEGGELGPFVPTPDGALLHAACLESSEEGALATALKNSPGPGARQAPMQ